MCSTNLTRVFYRVNCIFNNVAFIRFFFFVFVVFGLSKILTRSFVGSVNYIHGPLPEDVLQALSCCLNLSICQA